VAGEVSRSPEQGREIKANDGGGSVQIEFDCSRNESERGRERERVAAARCGDDLGLGRGCGRRLYMAAGVG
jgi:hypothetical protein